MKCACPTKLYLKPKSRIFVMDDQDVRLDWFRESLGENLLFTASNASDALAWLEAGGEADLYFLDHDLGSDDCGCLIVKWFAEHRPKQAPRIVIHSMNSVAAQKMQDMLPGSYLLPFGIFQFVRPEDDERTVPSAL